MLEIRWWPAAFHTITTGDALWMVPEVASVITLPLMPDHTKLSIQFQP